MSTKIHAMVDALGNPTGFFLTGDQAHDPVGADHLLPGSDADKRVIEPLAAEGKAAVIPSKAARKLAGHYDRNLYKARHPIENFFAKLRQFRAIATRYDKTAENCLGGIHHAALVWLN